MPFKATVKTKFLWDDLEDQVRKKVNEIADDQGRASHGGVLLTDGTSCQHWRAGDYRIFGTWDRGQGQLNFIGYGAHTGKGSSKYKVTREDGSTTKATTD